MERKWFYERDFSASKSLLRSLRVIFIPKTSLNLRAWGTEEFHQRIVVMNRKHTFEHIAASKWTQIIFHSRHFFRRDELKGLWRFFSSCRCIISTKSSNSCQNHQFKLIMPTQIWKLASIVLRMTIFAPSSHFSAFRENRTRCRRGWTEIRLR